MRKQAIIWGFINCLIAVVLGAFGAHSLKAKISEAAINTFEIGIRYQFYHALALCIIGILAFQFSAFKIKVPVVLFQIGIILFSGSLYLLACKSILNLPLAVIGPLTPLGGTCFIVAWSILIFNFIKTNANVE